MQAKECKIEVRMLGSFSITVDGRPVRFPYEKLKMLCAYLITESRLLHRCHVAELLWPNVDLNNSRQNLRQALATIKRALGDEYSNLFKVDRQTIEFIGHQRCSIDTEYVKEIAQSPLIIDWKTQAGLLALYHGQFCEGIKVREGTEFNRWLGLRRQQFHSYFLAYAPKWPLGSKFHDSWISHWSSRTIGV